MIFVVVKFHILIVHTYITNALFTFCKPIWQLSEHYNIYKLTVDLWPKLNNDILLKKSLPQWISSNNFWGGSIKKSSSVLAWLVEHFGVNIALSGRQYCVTRMTFWLISIATRTVESEFKSNPIFTNFSDFPVVSDFLSDFIRFLSNFYLIFSDF